MIILFTGNGKGKTTASLGQMVRVSGRGRSALMIQFIKGPWESGEDKFVERFEKFFRESRDPESKRGTDLQFQIKKMGLGFVGILGDSLPFAKHVEAARKALEYFKEEAKSDKWHLIVLDEVNNAIDLKLLDVQEVLDAVKDFPQNKILILTGRNAPKELIELADLATEMKEIKHPYQNKKLAKITVEF